MTSSVDERTRIYRIPPTRPQYRRRRRPKRKNGFFKFLLLICIIIGCIYYYTDYKINNEIKNSFDVSNDATTRSPLDLNFNISPRTQNILLMGVDVAENPQTPFKGARSDTMLLISVAPYGKNVNVISIPRDSKVYIAGKTKVDKINHAFAYGGPKTAVRTVEESFGVKIHNYLAISNTGVIKMVDLLGGLPIYIEKDMKYDDYSGNLHINLKRGNQILSGKQTEGYLRFRHDSYGDIGRIRRQQWFFNALLERLKDPTVIVKLPELLKTMPEYIQTDLSAYDMTKYLSMAKNIDTSTIQVATIPGAPSTKGIISYWIIDPTKTQDLINKMVYRSKSSKTARDLSVGILYANSKSQSAQTLKEELEAKGMQVKMQASNLVSKDYIAIHNLDISGDIVNDLKKTVPEIKDKHTIYDPIGVNRTGRDLTIVISDL